uniref:PUM-HD domain-containing protein n=1 Tax=Macrostomum lignano TaxID=282301 RepID=A0A1I8FKS4_9PLAT
AGANLRQQQQQPILRPILNDLRPGLAAAPADGEYQRVTVRESLASLRARNALPMTAGRPASAAAAATASQQRPLHLGGRLAGQAAAPEDSLYEDLYDAELRGAGGGLGDSYSDLYSEYNTDGLRESASNSMSSLVGAFGAPRVPPFRAAGRSPRDAVRRFSGRQQPGGGGSGFNILNEMQNFRHMDSDVDIAAASLRSSRPPPPPPPQHRQQQPPPPPPRSTDCLRRPCRYRPASAGAAASLGRQPAMTPLMERSIEGSLLDGSAGYDRLAASSSDDYSAGAGGEYTSETLRVAALVHRSGRPASGHSDSAAGGGGSQAGQCLKQWNLADTTGSVRVWSWSTRFPHPSAITEPRPWARPRTSSFRRLWSGSRISRSTGSQCCCATSDSTDGSSRPVSSAQAIRMAQAATRKVAAVPATRPTQLWLRTTSGLASCCSRKRWMSAGRSASIALPICRSPLVHRACCRGTADLGHFGLPAVAGVVALPKKVQQLVGAVLQDLSVQGQRLLSCGLNRDVF